MRYFYLRFEYFFIRILTAIAVSAIVMLALSGLGVTDGNDYVTSFFVVGAIGALTQYIQLMLD